MQPRCRSVSPAEPQQLAVWLAILALPIGSPLVVPPIPTTLSSRTVLLVSVSIVFVAWFSTLSPRQLVLIPSQFQVRFFNFFWPETWLTVDQELMSPLAHIMFDNDDFMLGWETRGEMVDQQDNEIWMATNEVPFLFSSSTQSLHDDAALANLIGTDKQHRSILSHHTTRNQLVNTPLQPRQII